MASVFGVEVILAPAEALDGRVELFFARRDDGLVGEGGQVLLAFDAGVESRANPPDAGAVFGVRAGGDEESVHGPVVVGLDVAEGGEFQRRGELRNCGFHVSCLSWSG